jgi:hypothetical protein
MMEEGSPKNEKRSRHDPFDAKTFLKELQSKLETQEEAAKSASPDGPTAVLEHYRIRGGLNMSAFQRTLMEGGFIELALAQGRSPNWIAEHIGLIDPTQLP